MRFQGELQTPRRVYAVTWLVLTSTWTQRILGMELLLGKANRNLYQAWSNTDPVDEWECERCKRIEAIQGNENKVVKNACKKAGLW